MPRMKSIDHVHVSVRDRAAAERWYAKVLGLTRAKDLEFWAANGGPLTVRNDEGTVHLALFEGVPVARPPTVAFEVDAKEFVLWRFHLGQMLGDPLKAEDHAVSWSLYFSDPDGNRFEVTSYQYESIKRELAKTAV